MIPTVNRFDCVEALLKTELYLLEQGTLFEPGFQALDWALAKNSKSRAVYAHCLSLILPRYTNVAVSDFDLNFQLRMLLDIRRDLAYGP